MLNTDIESYPNYTRIEDFLIKYSGKEVYYYPNPGNGGDALIAFATYQLFKKLKINYKIIKGEENLADKIVFYGGGGNLVGEYSDCAKFINDNQYIVKELVVLPQSIKDHADLLNHANDKLTFISREPVTFQYLREFPNIKHILLCDDLALSMNLDDIRLKNLIDRLVYLSKPKDIGSSIKRKKRTIAFYFKKRSIRKDLYAFREDAERTKMKLPDHNVDVTQVINFDSSMTQEKKVYNTVSNIISFLNQFDEIYTNRLHVCIAAAKIKKKVYFYPNSYWKNKSIYDFSLKSRFENIHWCDE